jgi:hypothetical protein
VLGSALDARRATLEVHRKVLESSTTEFLFQSFSQRLRREDMGA